MTPKQIAISILLAAAAILVGVFAVWKGFIEKKLAPKATPGSNTFDPRTWNLSEEDNTIINTLGKNGQLWVQDTWKAAIAENPNQSGELLYKRLIRVAAETFSNT